MDRKEFDSLKIEEQIKYINGELYNGCTLTKVCSLIGISRSTVRKRFKKVGQKYDDSINKYVGDNNKTAITGDNGKTEISCDEDKTTVIDDKSQTIVPKDIMQSETLVPNKEALKNLLDLSKKHDKIIEVINWFESDKDKTNVIEVREGIKIDLPEEIDTEFRKTVRINDAVWKQFSEFCKEHGEFKQKDLHSQALLEYIEKYKK